VKYQGSQCYSYPTVTVKY